MGFVSGALAVFEIYDTLRQDEHALGSLLVSGKWVPCPRRRLGVGSPVTPTVQNVRHPQQQPPVIVLVPPFFSLCVATHDP